MDPRTKTGKIEEIPVQLREQTGPGPRKISKAWTGPNQEQQNFENLGPIETGQSSDLVARGSPMYSINSNSHDRKS